MPYNFHTKTAPLFLLGLLSSFSINAAEESNQLDKVVVSAKTPVKVSEFAGTISVITAAEIKARGASSVTEALETMPGIQLVVTGSNSTKAPQIRGQQAEQILVLIDGKRIPNVARNLPFSPEVRFDWVPVANIERIEVIRGPASSLYGADAMAGVINIITRSADEFWGGNISLYGKKTDTANGGDAEGISLSVAGPLSRNTDLVLALESNQRDAIFDENNDITIQSEKKNERYQANLGTDLNPSSRLEFGVLFGTDEGIDFDNGFFGLSTIEREHERARYNLNYSTTLGNVDSDFGITSGRSDIEEGTAVWDIVENGANADFQTALNPHSTLSFGVNYREEEAERNDSIVFSDEVDATTLFAQDVINIGKKNILTLGFAYDNHSKYDDESSPKINWLHRLTPEIGIKAGYGESYLAPSLREGSSAYVVPAGPNRRYEGNDDLQPETAETFELGITFNDKNYTGAITVFKTDIDDLINIESEIVATVDVGTYTNIDQAHLKGLEVNGAFVLLNQSANLDISYTYLDSENGSGINKGKRLTNRAEHTAKIFYSQDIEALGASVDANWRYTGEQFTDSANTESIDSYHVADLGMTKALFTNVQLRFDIDNIEDKKVIDTSIDELLEEGRSYKLTLSSSF